MPLPMNSSQAHAHRRDEEDEANPRHGAPCWWFHYKDVSMDAVMSPSFNPEETRLPAILLHVKSNEMKGKVFTYSKTSGAQIAGESKYDRIFLFGCLGTNTCFAVLSKTAKHSSYFLQDFIARECCVGQTLMILEPIYSKNTLGDNSNLPIFDVKKRFEPHMFSSIPTMMYDPPKEAITRYFVLHNMQIQVLVPVVQRSVCNGIFCDRQSLRGSENHCCCLFRSGESSLVLETYVKVFTGNEMILEMPDF